MQARDAHEVRHARDPKHLPRAAVNRRLIAHHQGGQHTGHGLGQAPIQQPLAHALTRPLQGVPPGLRQPLGRWVIRPLAHIAGGADALLPQPKLVVKAVRVDVAMRRLQAHAQAPTLARPHLLRLHGNRTVFGRRAVPAQIQLAGHLHRQALQAGLLHLKTKSPARVLLLGHGHHAAHHIQVAPLQLGVNGFGHGARVQARDAPGQAAQTAHTPGRPAPPQPGAQTQYYHQRVAPSGPQLGLLQLQSHAQHPGQHKPGPADRGRRWFHVVSLRAPGLGWLARLLLDAVGI